ncbi:hypothetical protein AGLY_017557 [Aphis glycines]|uniref:Uncharacterized protein n=1 Tax=Aphis glycines TaxID=307491 RepID=A0A6G0SWK0_APHGL|nr:hypothetical protein AGLY_017557 [Aphis glycines]
MYGKFYGQSGMFKAVPMGNELEFSTKANFYDMTIEDDTAVFEPTYTREYFKFDFRGELVSETLGAKKYIQIDQSDDTAADLDNVIVDLDSIDTVFLPQAQVVVRIDRPQGNARNSDVNVTCKLRLMRKSYDYRYFARITASVSYETEFPKSVSETFSKNALGIHKTLPHAQKVCKTRHYYVYLTVRNTLYKFRIAFREQLENSDDEIRKFKWKRINREHESVYQFTNSKQFCEVDVECEDIGIDADVFSELALTCLDYIAYQYVTYNRRVVDLRFSGSCWDSYTYERRLSPELREAFKNATGARDGAPAAAAAAAAKPSALKEQCERNEYDDLVTYLGLYGMAKLPDSSGIATAVCANPVVAQMFKHIHVKC